MRDNSILLIQRGNDPFTGCWALPGGYVEPGEAIIDAAIRELKEETGLTGVGLHQVGTYGDPGRDPRGWTATVAHVGFVDEPVAKAGDDAASAKWFPLNQLPTLAFDHETIVKDVFLELGL
jgi:8-oxo-dGTP diphosphatase